MFGRPRDASIDFLIVGQKSAANLFESRYSVAPPHLPSDHFVLLSTTLLPDKFQPSQKGSAKKMIGWTPTDSTSYDDDIVEALKPSSTVRISDLTDVIFSAAT